MNTHREEQIDRFIGNEMEPEEQQAFCHELEEDEELKRHVKLCAFAADAVTREAEKAAWQALKQQPKKQRPEKSNRKRWISAAAVAAMVLGVLFFIGNSNRYVTTEIFSSYYEQPVIEPSRGENEVRNTLNMAGKYLAQEQAQDALELLTPEVLDSEYSEEAEWMLLCAYLQANLRKEAGQTAESISRKGGQYAEKAKEIGKKLKEKKWF